MSGTTEQPAAASLRDLAGALNPVVAAILDRALAGEDITAEEGAVLFATTGPEYNAMVLAADELRRRTVGDIATYVVNRNVNFTNVCIKRCGFCAFSRDFREEEGYFLPIEEIVRRAREAWDYGATEVCIQAGLPPQMEGDLYIRLCSAIKEALPDMHIHGFSPEEVLYGSIRSRCTIREYLEGLKAAGVGSLPGTSAEVLDQELRDRISPGRITVDQWIEVITTAHEIGIPTTSTVMFGHRETPEQLCSHMALLRGLQQRTGGITELRKIASMAEAYYVPMSPHNAMGPLQIVAGSHVMMNTPNFYRLEHSTSFIEAYNRLTTEPMNFHGGEFSLSGKPGLGVDFDMEALRAHLHPEWT